MKKYGRGGVVIKKYKDRLSFENPGTFRISLKEAIDGGMSDPRNATLLKMFSMIDIGERAGSGIPGVFSVWDKEFGIVPEYSQKLSPERTTTILKLSQALKENNVSNDTINKGLLGILPSKFPSKLPSKIEITFKAICDDNYASNQELAVRTNQSERTIRNHTSKLKEMNFIKRVGSDKGGHWKIIPNPLSAK